MPSEAIHVFRKCLNRSDKEGPQLPYQAMQPTAGGRTATLVRSKSFWTSASVKPPRNRQSRGGTAFLKIKGADEPFPGTHARGATILSRDREFERVQAFADAMFSGIQLYRESMAMWNPSIMAVFPWPTFRHRDEAIQLKWIRAFAWMQSLEGYSFRHVRAPTLLHSKP
jgi:hypothetical protein